MATLDLRKMMLDLIDQHLSDMPLSAKQRLRQTDVRILVPIPTRENSESLISNGPKGLGSKLVSPASVSKRGDTWIIKIHPVLVPKTIMSLDDSPHKMSIQKKDAPSYVLNYLIYHELIHVALEQDERHHGETFLKIERRYKTREKVRKWLSEKGFCIVEDYTA